MKVIMYILFTVFAMLLLCSCGKRVIAVKTETVKKDSISTVYNYKDTIIKRPARVVKITDTVPCPEANYTAIKKDSTGKLTAKVTLQKGLLHVECNVDSLQERISWLEKNQFSLKEHTSIKEVPVNVPTPYIPKWLLWICLISATINAWCFRKPIFTVIKSLIPNG